MWTGCPRCLADRLRQFVLGLDFLSLRQLRLRSRFALLGCEGRRARSGASLFDPLTPPFLLSSNARQTGHTPVSAPLSAPSE